MMKITQTDTPAISREAYEELRSYVADELPLASSLRTETPAQVVAAAAEAEAELLADRRERAGFEALETQVAELVFGDTYRGQPATPAELTAARERGFDGLDPGLSFSRDLPIGGLTLLQQFAMAVVRDEAHPAHQSPLEDASRPALAVLAGHQ